MTPTDDAAATRLLDEYRRAGGNADTIADIGSQRSSAPAAIVLVAAWLAELEDRWPGPETEGRELARLGLVKDSAARNPARLRRSLR
ncbi:hypothetical protein [Nocardia farcinica]|uniref:hypothetical protein n=1 Tax=Nocardia farcinica TaxID=37329 RepID=UPI000DF8F39E|nr:hypothetical protein [Nocardia farcinica]SUE27741.1 Uncharacterised protein [Nocardia farcinica]